MVIMPVERPEALAVPSPIVQHMLVKHPFHRIGGEQAQWYSDHGVVPFLLLRLPVTHL
jgi:hypothetical protein